MVLILILMEHAQRDIQNRTTIVYFSDVLILILMEHAQREARFSAVADGNNGLNPYFNGTCSKRIRQIY